MKSLFRYWLLWLLSKIYSSYVPTILMYHSISDNAEFFTVTSSMFEKQMRFLVENKFNFVSIERVSDFYLKGTPLPDKAVCITFDDGYMDNVDEALPILEKYNIPATIFVATDYVINEKSDKGLSIMKLDDLKKISTNPLITIGAHTHKHPRLSRLNKEEAYNDINLGKELLQKWTGSEINYFAYPKGDFNEETVQIVKKLGFNLAVTVIPGYVGNNDRFIIGRVPVDKSLPFWLFKKSCRKSFTVYTEWRKKVFG